MLQFDNSFEQLGEEKKKKEGFREWLGDQYSSYRSLARIKCSNAQIAAQCD